MLYVVLFWFWIQPGNEKGDAQDGVLKKRIYILLKDRLVLILSAEFS